jgi:hypothetical protein
MVDLALALSAAVMIALAVDLAVLAVWVQGHRRRMAS